jgi:phosphohistidine phosphatase
MKTLILVRHAKSSWDDLSVPDAERPLNERGKRDAPRMAVRLRQQFPEINAFVASPARRTRKTAELFMKEFQSKDKKPKLVPGLYEASLKEFYQVVESLNDEDKSVAIFAHNPTITNFANSLECRTVENIPTCAVYAVNADTESWKDFKQAVKEFRFFDYPRHIS